MIVVDDHFIAARLAAGTLGIAEAEVATTCSWWWRLACALAGSRGGALSRYFEQLDPGQRAAMVRTVRGLPSRLLVLDLRELIPAMAALSARYNLNQLAAEAIVVTEILEAELLVAKHTPKVRDTAAARGLAYRLAS